MNEFDKSIIEAGKLFKRGYTALEGSISKIIAVITGALAILLTFAEITPPSLITATLGTDLAVMLISSYIIYFSLEDAGERLGKDSEEYKLAKEKYTSLVGRVDAEMIADLREFLTDYQKEEQEYRTRLAMIREGVSKEELEAYKRGEIIDRKRLRALKRAASVKPIDISAHTILDDGCAMTNSGIENPGKSRLLHLILKLIPSTLCLLFTVSMMISAKDGINASAIISGIVKLSTLPIIGLKGYSAGYAYITESESAWLAAKSRLLEAFLNRHTAMCGEAA